MEKQAFISRKIKYNHKTVGAIKLHTVDDLPYGVKQATSVRDFINYSGSIKRDIVYFLKNIKGSYYIEITSFKTSERELINHIKRGILYY